MKDKYNHIHFREYRKYIINSKNSRKIEIEENERNKSRSK